MAGPGGREVGRVSIRVLPDTSKFGTSLNAYLERIEQRLDLEIPVSLNERTVAETEAQLALLTRDREIDLEMNSQALANNVTGITRGFAKWAPLILAASFAIGALVAALPAALSLLAAPITAIALGFDGIKAAASVLSDEFDGLRQSLSDVFEQLLTPGFERLGDLFSTLTDGLGDVALGVSRLFDSFTRAITAEDAMKAIGDIFANVGQALETFAANGGVDAFVDSILALAQAGTEAAAALTPEFVALFQGFSDTLSAMAENGDLAKGMEGIGHAIYFVLTAVGFFVLAGLEFMALLERIGEAIHEFFTVTVPEALAAFKAQIDADWESIKEATRDAWSAIQQTVVDAVTGLVQGAVTAMVSLPAKFTEIGADAIQGLWDGMTGVMDRLTSWLAEKASGILSVFSGLWDLGSPSKEFARIGRFAAEGLQIGFEEGMAGVEASAQVMATTALRGAAYLPDTPSHSDPIGRRVALTITNWRDGTGFFEELVEGQIGEQAFEFGVSA